MIIRLSMPFDYNEYCYENWLIYDNKIKNNFHKNIQISTLFYKKIVQSKSNRWCYY